MQGSAVKREEVRRSQRAFGAFICVIGFALFLIVVSRLGLFLPSLSAVETPPLGISKAFLVLFSLSNIALGIYILFQCIAQTTENLPNSSDRPGPPERALQQILRGAHRMAAIIAVLLVAWGAVSLWTMAPERPQRSPEFDKFAIAFEPERQEAGANAPNVVGGAIQQATPENQADELPDSAIFWWVKRMQPSPYEGLLPMLLGSILVIIFGLSYARMAVSEATMTVEVVQKLVMPALSLALFGLGASQQVAAANAERDEQLIRQALPPIHILPDGERLRILTAVNVLPGTAASLESSISLMQRNINNPGSSGGQPSPEIENLTHSIDRMREEISNARNSQSIVRMNNTLASIAASIRQAKAQKQTISSSNDPLVAQSIDSLNTALIKRLDHLREQNCALVLLEAEAASRAESAVRQEANRDRRNIVQRIGKGIAGESSATLEQRQRDAIADATARRTRALQDLGDTCVSR